MSGYSQAIEKLNEQKADDKHAPLPCSYCKTPTQRETLSQYGNRCLRCFDAYCEGDRLRFAA